MFNWFKKKHTKYPAESRWSVLNGKNAGNPMLLRRNDSAHELLGNAEYRFRVGIAVPFIEADEHGFPGKTEIEQLNAIEDALSSRLEENQLSLHVLAITTGGMREFVFYTRDASAAQTALESVKNEVNSHVLQSYISQDPKWKVYKQFA